jgi:hypothetical protein
LFVSAADVVHDVFAQLAAEPVQFQGIEWADFQLDAADRVSEEFYSRFGCEGGISCSATAGSWTRTRIFAMK